MLLLVSSALYLKIASETLYQGYAILLLVTLGLLPIYTNLGHFGPIQHTKTGILSVTDVVKHPRETRLLERMAHNAKS